MRIFYPNVFYRFTFIKSISFSLSRSSRRPLEISNFLLPHFTTQSAERRLINWIICPHTSSMELSATSIGRKFKIPIDRFTPQLGVLMCISLCCFFFWNLFMKIYGKRLFSSPLAHFCCVTLIAHLFDISSVRCLSKEKLQRRPASCCCCCDTQLNSFID